MKYYQSIQIMSFFFLITIFLSNCASVVPPTGGNKDEEPPKLLRTYPENKSTNFTEKTIWLEFDEWITTESFTTELVITPAFKNYDYKTKQNRLILTLKEALQENTTYNFNFRKGVADITEGNTTNNIRLAFSTGDILDSLFIKGSVKALLSNQAQEDILVALYPVDDTLKVEEHPPYYFAFTNEEGDYSLENIKAGRYRLYAFKDENNNLTYEEPEAIAFEKEIITLQDSSLNEVKLNVVKENNSIPKIQSSRSKGVYYDISFREGLKKVEVEGNTKYDLNPEGKVLRFYNINQVFDSIPLKIIAEDSAGNILEEELNIIFNEKTKEKPVPFQFDVELEGKNKWENRLTFEVKFNKPVENFDFEKIKYRTDWGKEYKNQNWSEQLYYLVDEREVLPKNLLQGKNAYEWNATRTILKIDTVIDFENSLEILIEKETFFSVEQDTNTFFNQNYFKKDPKQYGTIGGEVITESSSYTLQLLNENLEVIKELKKPKEFYFEFLPAGLYFLRVLIDENQNGRWDASNALENQEAEPIFFHESPIKIRENWDIENILLEF